MFVLEVSQIKNEERVWEIYLFESFQFPFVLDYSYTSIWKGDSATFESYFINNTYIYCMHRYVNVQIIYFFTH